MIPVLLLVFHLVSSFGTGFINKITESRMMILLLVFHPVQALGTLKNSVNLIIKKNNCVFFNFI